MNSMNGTGADAGPAPGRPNHTHRLRGLAVTGFIATPAAMVLTSLAAALGKAGGVDGLRLVPATVMIPTLARGLGTHDASEAGSC